jgi:hypothetical protein
VNDEVIAIHEIPRNLVGQVLALMSDLAVGAGHPFDGAFPVTRPSLFARQLALGGGQSSARFSSVATVDDKPAVTGRHLGNHPKVDSHVLAGGG